MILADARHLPIASGVVQCCVTSPPYWGLRDYRAVGQIGLEATPDDYICELVATFREVHRVLRDDGVCWLNLGDSYAGSWGAQSRGNTAGEASSKLEGSSMLEARKIQAFPLGQTQTGSLKRTPGLKNKDLVGVPWRVALALQADGWWLRSDVIWAKPNCMPESVTDRPTRSHEYVFLLTKSERYFYDAAAIRNPPAASTLRQVEDGYSGSATKAFAAAGVQDASMVKARIIKGRRDKQRGHSRRHNGFNDRWDQMSAEEQRALGSNARSVWMISPQAYDGAHFATMPEALARRCILAGSRPGDLVLDPFLGSGTVARVAISLGRRAVGCDLQRDYLPLQRERMQVTRGLPLEHEVPA
jgi:DNA modification methylase